MENCSGFLPYKGAAELNQEKQMPPKALAQHVHNRFSIIQDNEARGDRKASNISNTETQQSLAGSITDA